MTSKLNPHIQKKLKNQAEKEECLSLGFNIESRLVEDVGVRGVAVELSADVHHLHCSCTAPLVRSCVETGGAA